MTTPDSPRPRSQRTSVRSQFFVHVRTTLLTGVVLILPVAVTVWLFTVVVVPLDGTLQPILRRALHRDIPGLGVVTLFLLLYGVGLVGRNVLGRMFFSMLEGFFQRIPVARSLYNATKELLSAFNLTHDGVPAFREVCLLEYPRAGLLAMGFVTSRVRITGSGADREAVTVFVPNPPNPATGQFVIIPVEEVIGVDMSVEEGIKMVLSGGLVAPLEIRMRAAEGRR